MSRSFQPFRAWLLLVGGCIGVTVFWGLRNDAFQWAALDLSVSKSEITEKAGRYLLQGTGVDATGFKSVTTFEADEKALLYLDKTFGTSRTNEILSSHVLPVWKWEVKFFNLNRKDVYRIYLDTRGKWLGLDIHAATARSAGKMTTAGARSALENLAKVRLGIDLSEFKQSEGSFTQDAESESNTFTWERPTTVEGIALQVEGSMKYGTLQRIHQRLKLSAAFEAKEGETLVARGKVLSLVFLPYIIFFIAALAVAVRKRAGSSTPWGAALKIGGFLAVVHLCAFSNSLPLMWKSANPIMGGYSAFWWMVVASMLFGLIIQALSTTVSVAAADRISRKTPGVTYAFEALTHVGFYASRPAREATVAGYGLAGIALGYVTIFYVAGRLLGWVYTPLEVPYSNWLSTSTPWIAALVMGLSAAITEEAMFRAFAIGWIERWTGKRWIAVVLSSVVWAFLHTNYYVEPIWTRGLELTIAGVIWGIAYLKFGIWSTLVAHFLYNVVVYQAFVGTRGSVSEIVVSVALVLFPLVPLALSRFLPKSAWNPAVSLEDTGPIESSAPKPVRIVRTDKSSWRERVDLPTLIGLVAAGGIIACPVRVREPKDPVPLSKAIGSAQGFLRAAGYGESFALVRRGLDEERPDDELRDYVKKNPYWGKGVRLLDRHSPEGPYWTLTFKDVEEQEQVTVRIATNARTVNFWSYSLKPILKPLRPLKTEEALARERRFLKAWGEKVENLDPYWHGIEDRSEGSTSVRYWSDKTSFVGAMSRVLQLSVRGDRIVGFSDYIHLRTESKPGDDESERSNFFWRFFWILKWAFYALLLAVFLFGFVGESAPPSVSSRLGWLVGATMALLNLGGAIIIDKAELLNFSLFGKIPSALMEGAFAFVIVTLFLRYSPPSYANVFRTLPWRWPQARSGLLWGVVGVGIWMLGATLTSWVAGLEYVELVPYPYRPLSNDFSLLSTLTEGSGVLTRLFAIATFFAILRNRSGVIVQSLLGVLLLAAFFGSLGNLSVSSSPIRVGDAVQLLLAVILGFPPAMLVWLVAIERCLPYIFWVTRLEEGVGYQAMILLGCITVGAAGVFAGRRKEDEAPQRLRAVERPEKMSPPKAARKIWTWPAIGLFAAAIAIVLFKLGRDVEETAHSVPLPPVNVPAGTNELNLFPEGKMTALNMAVPIELDFMMKSEVYNLRRKAVARFSHFLAKPYEPSDVVYGQIQDKKPWWGLLGIYHYGGGQQSIEGPSEESRMLLNPFVLIYPIEYWAYRVKDPKLRPLSHPPVVRSAVWKTGQTPEIEMHIDVTKFFQAHGPGSELAREKTPIMLDTLNARDFGFRHFDFDRERSKSITPLTEVAGPRSTVSFIHVGGSCGYPGGCNNSSPTDQNKAFIVDAIPARVELKLWRDAIGGTTDAPSVRCIMLLE